MAGLTVQGLVAHSGRFQLGPLDLELLDGETTILLGPSGSGKTTLIETLAGFHIPDAGRILAGGRDITDVAPERRRLALVVQDYALFPHLSVRENVAFGLRYQRRPAKQAEVTLEALGIAHLAGRRIQGLSGGERQRVALARALAAEPEAFLLDEPLAALDAATRRAVRVELGHFLQRTRTTCLLVTHDQADAFALGDQLVLIRQGRIQQAGAPEWVYRRPANAWVAGFLGMELLTASQIDVGPSTTYAVAGVPLRVATEATVTGTQLAYRPEDVALSVAGEAGINALPGRIEGISPDGPLLRVDVCLADGESLVALASRRELQQLGATPGQAITCRIAPPDLWPLPDDA